MICALEDKEEHFRLSEGAESLTFQVYVSFNLKTHLKHMLLFKLKVISNIRQHVSSVLFIRYIYFTCNIYKV